MKIFEFVDEQIINVDGFEHQLGDIEAAADWIGKPIDKLRVEVINEPIDMFIKQIKEMYKTYEKFPQDARRTQVILRKLKSGYPEYPIYVDKRDREKFIMEGRHRIVAFWLAGFKEIPVAYVY